jgi:hypothetical protein
MRREDHSAAADLLETCEPVRRVDQPNALLLKLVGYVSVVDELTKHVHRAVGGLPDPPGYSESVYHAMAVASRRDPYHLHPYEPTTGTRSPACLPSGLMSRYPTGVRSLTDQSGRGGFRLLVLVVLLALAGFVAWNFVNARSSSIQVTSSAASADSGRQKALAFANAQAQAQRTGRPVSVVESFTDAELSSLANEAAQQEGLPIDQISLHSTSEGTVKGQAQAHVAGTSVPVTLEGSPVVTGNRVALNVTSTHVGAIPLPGALSDQVAQAIRQPLQLGAPISGFQNLQVKASEGQLTVSGVAQPA